MQVRHTGDRHRFSRMNTTELRESYLVDNLFEHGMVRLLYWEADRTIVGSAAPTIEALPLEATKELASKFFAERREIGVINIGPAGTVYADGVPHALDTRDALYIGRGSEDVYFESADPDNPALFYILSYPAHAAYPTTLIKAADAEPVELGSPKQANRRTIFKYIRPPQVQSCQLVMGITQLAEGSAWNTMPPHTHARRTEVYLYFDLPKEEVVFHLMGTPKESRHIVMKNREAVLSPSWSFHAGVGTRNYAFIWGMGGENQEFGDMDHVKAEDLK